jgi:hypothetical protein
MIVAWWLTEIITVYGLNSNVVTNYSLCDNVLKALDVLNVTRIHDDDPGLSNSDVLKCYVELLCKAKSNFEVIDACRKLKKTLHSGSQVQWQE